MINLIPQEEKKKMIRGFYYRLIVLFLVMASACILVALVAILPSYFLSFVRYNVVLEKLEIQKNEPVPVPDQQTLLVIKDLGQKLSLIEKAENNQFLLSQRVITALVSNKTPEIKITTISYENDPLKGKKVSIQGTSPSREILLAFRLTLENNQLFKQVDLPISNFVKGKDIQFYLSLIPS